MYYEQLIRKAEKSEAWVRRLKFKGDKLFRKAQMARDRTRDPKAYRWRFNKANHYYDRADECQLKAEKLYADAEALKTSGE